jgi:hypothetical protein
MVMEPLPIELAQKKDPASRMTRVAASKPVTVPKLTVQSAERGRIPRLGEISAPPRGHFV